MGKGGDKKRKKKGEEREIGKIWDREGKERFREKLKVKKKKKKEIEE